jgi:Tol biopolymer transport system component
VASYPVEGRAAALSFSSDGKRLVFERVQRGRYQEIVVLELDGGKLTALTNNDSPDRSPLFSPDGKRVYFEARNSDPVFGRKRAVVRIAWVPTP